MKLPTAKDWVVTQASFPEQDWSLWEQRRYMHPGQGQTIDTKYLQVWPCCIHCATWICSACWNFRRVRATRRADQYCARCGSREGFFSATRHGTKSQHEALPKVPFRVPVMKLDALELAKSWGERGGEAVRRLETHDGHLIKGISARQLLAYYKKVAIEQPNREKLMAITPPADEWPESTADEQEFWGIHQFKEAVDSLGCQLCGWGYNDQIHKKETKVHVPEEANMADEVLTADEAVALSEDEARERGFLPPKLDSSKMHVWDGVDENTKPEMQTPCLRCGATYRLGWNTECEAGSESAEDRDPYQPGPSEKLIETLSKIKARMGTETVMPHVVTMVLDKIRDAYANGNGPENILAFEIRYLSELCDLAVQYPYTDGDVDVLGPGVIIDPDEGVISWKGENYYLRQITDKDRKLIAENAKASIERRDRDRAERLLRETAMHHAVELQKAGLSAGHLPTKLVTEVADDILKWMTKES